MPRKLAKYEAITRRLLNDIKSGVYPPGSKLPSERQLATKYKIAHMTVNKALNGLVSANYLTRRPPLGTFVKARQQLKTAAAVMDYRSRHSMFPQPLQHALADAGFVLTAFDINQVIESPALFVEYCRTQRPDLLLVEGYSVFPYAVLDEWPDVQLIVFHKCERDLLPRAWHVLVDYEATGYQSARMLLDSGCTRLAAFLGLPDTPQHSDYQYLAGMRRAAAESGLELVADLTMEEQTLERLDALLAHDRVDGVAAVLDSLLVPLTRQAKALGLSIPDDVALIGHNNTPYAESHELTSLDARAEELAAEISRMLDNPPERGHCIRIAPTPVWRESCPEPALQTR